MPVALRLFAFLRDAARRIPHAVVLAVLLFAGLGAGPAASQALEAYRLGPGDRLKVTVFDHPRESGEFEIDSLGNINYPLLGRFQVSGSTIAEITERIRASLDKSYIVDPRVSVEVLKYRPFYIHGEVNRAGSYPYVIGLTVRRAVAIAGGFTRRARRSPVMLVREAGRGVDKLDLGLDDQVLPGDIIEIERRLF